MRLRDGIIRGSRGFINPSEIKKLYQSGCILIILTTIVFKNIYSDYKKIYYVLRCIFQLCLTPSPIKYKLVERKHVNMIHTKELLFIPRIFTSSST